MRAHLHNWKYAAQQQRSKLSKSLIQRLIVSCSIILPPNGQIICPSSLARSLRHIIPRALHEVQNFQGSETPPGARARRNSNFQFPWKTTSTCKIREAREVASLKPNRTAQQRRLTSAEMRPTARPKTWQSGLGDTLLQGSSSSSSEEQSFA